MLYTTEEAAVICGFLNAHLAQAGVEVSVRKRNAAFQRGVIMGTLQPDDYRWAENVLCFLKPCWWQLHKGDPLIIKVMLDTFKEPNCIVRLASVQFVNEDNQPISLFLNQGVNECSYAVLYIFRLFNFCC